MTALSRDERRYWANLARRDAEIRRAYRAGFKDGRRRATLTRPQRAALGAWDRRAGLAFVAGLVVVGEAMLIWPPVAMAVTGLVLAGVTFAWLFRRGDGF